MSRWIVTVSLGVALGWPQSALASSIKNLDDRDYTVTVIQGNATADHVLRPSATLEGVRDQGCVIRLNDSQDEYELKGSEVVSIEGGYLFYDGPPASAPPRAGDADQPPEPGAK